MRYAAAVVFALCVALSSAPKNGRANGTVDRAPEYAVKAAFIYHFGKFVEWPDEWSTERPDSFRVAVIGSNPFGAVIYQQLAGKVLGGRAVVVREIGAGEDLSGFHVAFVAAVHTDSLKSILDRMRSAATLTVGDTEDFIEAGGMVRFFISEDRRVRFEVNLRAVEDAGLSMSSRLLNVAQVVRE